MTTRTITVDEVWLRNGRIYFDLSDKGFFPERIGGRGENDKGSSVLIVVGGEEYETDIRKSGTRLSPRRSFKTYLHNIGAKHGGILKVERVDDRRSLPTYQMEYVG